MAVQPDPQAAVPVAPAVPALVRVPVAAPGRQAVEPVVLAVGQAPERVKAADGELSSAASTT
ncbi:hypothetical protein LAB08_R17630 [Pseudomonas izuensis]|uniref:Uncharacterized protein n=1 Tax=Pseudomonas izuensis TaxID=2684212 RepID=A0ABM7RPH3_9PSED|nr:hypothetical protein LAB08_R17630 [Pseudomonas izuensis]